MTDVTVLEVGRDAMLVVLKVSAPLLIAALAIGLIIAIFQALTSIQEMTLTFVPKIIVIFLALLVFLPYILDSMQVFMQGVANRIAGLG